LQSAMNRIRILALLPVAALLYSSNADAQARPPPPQWKDPSGPPVAMDVWLRRLVGQFTFEGMISVQGGDTQTVEGKGDCVSVGTGPGVQCVLNVTWLDIYVVNHGGEDLTSA